jgi:hypothetical protein
MREQPTTQDIAFERENMHMVFSYAEWQELIDTGKFDFTGSRRGRRFGCGS